MQLSFARKGSRFTLVCSLGLLTFACGDDDGGAPLPSGDAGTDAAVVDVTDTTDTTETGSDTTDTNTDTSIATTDTGLDTTDTVTSDTDITVVLDGGIDPDTTADLDADVTTDPGTTTDGADAEAPDAGLSDADIGPLPDAGDGAVDALDGGVDGTAAASIRAGAFTAVASADQGGGGVAQLIVLKDGETRVEVQVTGLPADTLYTARVHAFPCAFDDGGPPYLLDPADDAVPPANQLNLEVGTNELGVGHGRVTTEHRARGDALSVVVHEPNTDAALLCADLAPESLVELTGAGLLDPFAAAESVDQELSGRAGLVRGNDGTGVSLEVTGLAADQEYIAHVHHLPCGVAEAGGHYKFDPTVTEEVEDNELWLSIQATDAGTARSEIASDHLARLDAQSVVLHRVVGEEALKVACADLPLAGWEALETSGSFTRFSTPDAGLSDANARATMWRTLDGETEVSVELVGFAADTPYEIHVHHLPCEVSLGGGHYKFDESVTEEIEDNEIWLNLTTDGDGSGERAVTVAHLSRPEAQSVVVHEVGGLRLGCIQLWHEELR